MGNHNCWKINRNFIGGADYSQIENRIIALLSGDQKLLHWYNNDIDAHCETAKYLFDLADDISPKYWKAGAVCHVCKVIEFDCNYEVPCRTCKGPRLRWIDGPQQRQIAKGARYAFHYGASLETMFAQLSKDWPSMKMADVIRLRKKLEALHTGLMEYQRIQYDIARTNGYVEAPLSGRRFNFYGQVNMTQLRNIPIQTSGADIANPAIIRIHKDLEIDLHTGVSPNNESIVAQMHDAIYLEGPNPFRLYRTLKDNMEIDIELNGYVMKFLIDVGIGWTWDVKKVKNENDLKVTVLKLLEEGEQHGYCKRAA